MSAAKLNIHAKSLFLKHRGEKIFKSHSLVPASEFLNNLLISRQFLRASQLYKVYFFVVSGLDADNKFEVYFAHTFFTGEGTTRVKLTLSEVHNLNQLLKVRYFCIFPYVHDHTNGYSTLCKIFKGHVSLMFSPNDDANNHYPPPKIITQLQNQLYEISCDAEFLVDLTEVPRLNLHTGVLHGINFYQLKRVLINHQIGRLMFMNHRRWPAPRLDETIDDGYFSDFPLHSRLRKLNFRFDQLDENHEIIPKLTEMVRYFPNLKLLECYLLADRYASEQFGLQTLGAWISKKLKEIECLRKACPSTTFVQVCHSIRIRRQESKQALKQMVKYLLKETSFNILCCFQHNVDEPEQGLPARQYYIAELEWNEPLFFGFLRLIMDLNPQAMDEVAEEDDNLLIPLPSFFKFLPEIA